MLTKASQASGREYHYGSRCKHSPRSWTSLAAIRHGELILLLSQGYEQSVLVFNGSIPGPTIFADWGDDGKFLRETKAHDTRIVGYS
jgi:hypothetical protein